MPQTNEDFVRNVNVPLGTAEREALAAMADHEKREARQQAAFLIRWALQQKGYMPPDEPPHTPRPPLKPATHQAQDI